MSEAIGELVARADPPLYVVTTVSAGDRAGCVVGFATQASIDPPRFLVAISKENRTWQVAKDASHVAVHLFGRERMDVVERQQVLGFREPGGRDQLRCHREHAGQRDGQLVRQWFRHLFGEGHRQTRVRRRTGRRTSPPAH